MDVQNFSALASVYIKENPQFLDLALNSLVNQSLQASEVVLVHDGPLTSDLYEVIAKYKNKLPLKEVVLKENLGLGKALNAGLEQCTHDLVARFDTDDINRSNRFELQIEQFTNDTELVACSSYVEEFDVVPHDTGSIKKLPLSNSDICNYAKYRNPFNHMAMMFRKQAVIDSGSYMHLHFMEDYYLWLRLISRKYKCLNLEDVLVDARVGSGMYGRRKGLKYIHSEYELYKIHKGLGLLNYTQRIFSLIIRIIPRLLSTGMLKRVYLTLRSKRV